jgi:adenylosuccinate synthase
VDGVIGIFKAYSTRVGAGPLPTELDDGPEGSGEKLRKRGREYGTTTGRARRCGWFDGVAAAYSNRLNRFDAVCVMLLDVLDAFDEVRVCTAYRIDGVRTETIPASLPSSARVEAEYETLPGWMTDLSGVRRWEDLPPAARRYLDRLGEVIGAEVALASVGPERSQTVMRPGSWLSRRLEI